jgi:predicted nucleotidyltransferase
LPEPYHLIIPAGTQVVALVPVRVGGRSLDRGATGVVVRSPVDATHSYEVRFPDGTVAWLRRSEIAVRKAFQTGELAETGLTDRDLERFVIYRCVIGSRAYGLDTESSDVDRRGVYLPPADLQWSLFGVPEQIEDPRTRDCYWELQKFLVLALKANPNVLECLWSPLVEHATDLARELLDMKDAFLSKLVYVTFNGYVLSQFKKLNQDIRTKGEPKWKHAMHLVRLLVSGATLLREGTLPVRVDGHRDRLLAIRRGEVPWEEVEAWRLELHRDFDEAHRNTKLPDRPDYDRANAFLIRARRSVVA